MRSFFFSVVLVIGILCQSVYAQDNKIVNNLEFSIKTNQESYTASDTIALTACFTNRGKTPLLLCTFNMQRILTESIEIRISGQTYTMLIPNSTTLPQLSAGDYQLLEPDQSYQQQLDIAVTYPKNSSRSFKRKGYSESRLRLPAGAAAITARYTNIFFDYAPLPAAENIPSEKKPYVWLGEISANQIAITINE